MKPFEVVLAYPAVEFIERQVRSERAAIKAALQLIKESPHNRKDLTESHPSDREHFVFLRGKYAIKFWIDEWEFEVKVLNIQLRDRRQ